MTQPVPLFSVPMSLVNLFIKAVVLPMAGKTENKYLNFVAKKSWGETLSAPIPFIGGVVYCIARFNKQSQKANSTH